MCAKVTGISTEQAEAASPLFWAVNNKFVTENSKPLEFENRRFLIEPFDDMTKDQAIMKSAQVGWSVMNILKSAHVASKLRYNVIYILPTKSVVNDFVVPKVDKLIEFNPALRDLMKVDSRGLKQFGDRFVYYRGAFSEKEAISISADLLVGDEFDRCDQNVLNTYRSRLNASDWGAYWKFSNPSIPGFGVHELYQDSDQMHWLITCHRCNHATFIDWQESQEKNHFVDMETPAYRCGNCKRVLTNADRANGDWRPFRPENTKRRGYWLNQMMAPWVSPEKIVEEYQTGDLAYFHNFVLGLPYQAAELMINRESILRSTSPNPVRRIGMTLGVDNGIEKHWVLMKASDNAVVDYGVTESWDDIEGLINKYDATTVIDANPYPDIPKKLVKKYFGQVFINYYKIDQASMETIRFKEGDDYGIVHTDRTKIFDQVAGEIHSHELAFYMTHGEVDGIVRHAENMYRVVEENNAGIKRGKWMVKTNRPDHWMHALVYAKIARHYAMSTDGAGIIGADGGLRVKRGSIITSVGDGSSYSLDIDPMEIARKSGIGSRDWRGL